MRFICSDILCFLLLRNIPHVHLHEKRENKDKWHGAEIQIIIEGNWTTYRVSGASVTFLVKNLTIRFARRTDVMPPAPLETKHHPSANITSYSIVCFPGEMGPDFSPKMAVKNLTSQQIVRIHQLFRQAKFDDPSGDVSCCLSPAGEYNLRLGIIKELQPDMVATCSSRYIPDASRAIMDVLEEMAQNYEPKRQRYDKEDDELLNKVASKEITEMTFGESLSQYVEQVIVLIDLILSSVVIVIGSATDARS
ncbi:hypothetical protein GW17_00040885 [Ensete ventricosum]|nr:hypothetical protein GW17_00040885 [Ensete ventricosum]